MTRPASPQATCSLCPPHAPYFRRPLRRLSSALALRLRLRTRLRLRLRLAPRPRFRRSLSLSLSSLSRAFSFFEEAPLRSLSFSFSLLPVSVPLALPLRLAVPVLAALPLARAVAGAVAGAFARALARARPLSLPRPLARPLARALRVLPLAVVAGAVPPVAVSPFPSPPLVIPGIPTPLARVLLSAPLTVFPVALPLPLPTVLQGGRARSVPTQCALALRGLLGDAWQTACRGVRYCPPLPFNRALERLRAGRR